MPVTKQSYRYPKDEFDAVPEDAPAGVHRAPRSPWRKVVPFVVVAVVFAVLAYGGVTLVSNALDSSDASASTGQSTSSATSTTKTSAEPTTKATKKAKKKSTPAANVDKTTSIRVLNGAGIAGLAGKGTAELQSAGFTHAVVVTAPYSGTALSDSTVYYTTSADKGTAEQVAKTLGLTTVTELSGLQSPIEVVLVSALS